VKNGFDVRKCVKWAHIFVETKRRRPSCVCMCDRCNKWQTFVCFFWPL